jgi:type IV pilus biogenesis protein CpaD/CtpE
MRIVLFLVMALMLAGCASEKHVVTTPVPQAPQPQR